MHGKVEVEVEASGVGRVACRVKHGKVEKEVELTEKGGGAPAKGGSAVYGGASGGRRLRDGGNPDPARAAASGALPLNSPPQNTGTCLPGFKTCLQVGGGGVGTRKRERAGGW